MVKVKQCIEGHYYMMEFGSNKMDRQAFAVDHIEIAYSLYGMSADLQNLYNYKKIPPMF